ncbi:hypothetical protein IZ6_24320 [Terrihabitans soli]|uniref:Uncharacterized protein n=1 Tax=Terrihabitans soli TaxID=708113 RepID=A0A6S6QUV4_9HYPH|nr:hypothetical protein [Terrihabitans soli]BCJ91697.1 hypothetical protein IZ6_24320 [Terrihabitans soli]
MTLAISPASISSAADEFERKADDFAALAEEAKGPEDVARYRDLEHTYRLRAEEERARQIAHLYAPASGHGANA